VIITQTGKLQYAKLIYLQLFLNKIDITFNHSDVVSAGQVHKVSLHL